MTDVNKLISALIAVLNDKSTNSPRKAKVLFKDSKSNVTAKQDRQLDKLASVARGFNAKGIKNSEIVFRVDGSNAHNIRTYRGWQAEGRVVRKGQHGVRGMFHVSQTDVASPVPAIVDPLSLKVGDVVSA
jgi:hypothetical protein